MEPLDDKAELLDIISTFGQLNERLADLSTKHSSVMTFYTDGEFSISFAALVQMSEPRIDFYTKQLKKVAAKLPSNKKVRKTRSDTGKRRK